MVVDNAVIFADFADAVVAFRNAALASDGKAENDALVALADLFAARAAATCPVCLTRSVPSLN